MKIYIVEEGQAYDGSTLLGVYDTLAKAKARGKKSRWFKGWARPSRQHWISPANPEFAPWVSITKEEVR